MNIYNLKDSCNFWTVKKNEEWIMDNCSICGEEKLMSGRYVDGKFRCLSCDAKTKPDFFECKECGKFDHPSNWAKGTLRDGLCHTCTFWMDKFDIKESPKVARVGGEHFYIEPDAKNDNGFKGFGGARFGINFKDGRVILSHNLWSQGTIPKHFRDRMPDNAVFLEQETIERLIALGVL